MLAIPKVAMNLAVDYLGLRLKTPFIIGASPCCDSVQGARELEDGGAGAVVLRSLFEEQIEPQAPIVRRQNGRAGGDLDSYPDFADYQTSPEQYLRQIELLKSHLTIPVIASLNCHQPGSWTHFAARLERAGANAIELNFYQVVTDPGIDAEQVEIDMLKTVGLVAESVEIPVAVKLSPFHTSIVQLAVALELEGAAGVVLFNRFYQPDVNTENLAIQPVLRLSEPQELLLRLRWLAILSPHLRGSLAATGGIHTASGVVKALLTGAHAVQLVSVILKHGPKVLSILASGLEEWMRDRGFATIDAFCGLLNSRRCQDAAVFERANYIRTLQSWEVE